MRNLPPVSRDRLLDLFVSGLALAGAACATAPTAPPREGGPTDATGTTSVTLEDPPSTPPTTSPSVAPPASTDTDTPSTKSAADVQAYAREFSGAGSYAKALPGVELLGFIDIDRAVECSPGPCTKEWKALVDRPGARWLVVKRKGVLEGITAADFATAVGPVDTAEKAALRARLEEYRVPATCKQFREAGFDCKSGSGDSAVPVRQTKGGFEVATFGSRNVCSGSQQGTAKALGVAAVWPDGKLDPRVENEFTKVTAEQARIHQAVECRYPERGRMFEGFVDLAAEATELEYYLRAYRQESAAVVAFERLARELRAHGAPATLIDAALRSADDERRHAALLRCAYEQAANALGSAAALPDEASVDLGVRPLLEVLGENVDEGCANETYAAVIATYQGTHAPSARLRRLFGSIAADEREHAALAHGIHAWGLTQLDAESARALEARRVAACEALASHADMTDVGRVQMGEPAPELASLAFLHVATTLARAA